MIPLLLYWSKHVHVVFVYGREAHALQESTPGANDHWPLLSSRAMPNGNVARIEKQHSTNKERQAALKTFLSWFVEMKDSDITFVIDPIHGRFARCFNPWPTRMLFFISNDKKEVVFANKTYFKMGGDIELKEFLDHMSGVLRE